MGVLGAGMPAGAVDSPAVVEPCGAQVELSALGIVGRKLSIPIAAAPIDAVFRKPRRLVSAIIHLASLAEDDVSPRACRDVNAPPRIHADVSPTLTLCFNAPPALIPATHQVCTWKMHDRITAAGKHLQSEAVPREAASATHVGLD